jgi:DNA adenine methylase
MKNKSLEIKDRADFLQTPLRYPGHQIYALNNILSFIPSHQYYIEPFCGGASVFFGKAKVGYNLLNDIDTELIETYKIIRDQPERLISVLSKEKSSEQRYNHFKAEFIPKDNFETAVRWFYLNKTSRLELMSMFWEIDDKIKLKPANWSEGILECSKKLQNVELTSGDFEKLIHGATEGAFLFIAPPYSIHHSSVQNKLHKYPFERESHFRLANALKLKSNKIKFLMTYNENNEIREMYSWAEKLMIFNLSNEPPQKKEIVIMNYKI